MPIHNAGCAAVFAEIADMLEIQGANPFRVRAYRNAARTIADYGRDIPTMIANGDDLGKIPSIGPDLASKLRERSLRPAPANCSKRCVTRCRARSSSCSTCRGLGAKRVKALHDALHVDSLEQLRAEAKSEHVRELPGFGAKPKLICSKRSTTG